MHRLKSNSPIILIWLAVCVVMIFITRDQILSGIGWGPDDQLRQVQVRDWLAGQSWFDTTLYRIAEPDSQPMHWTRWIEVPIAFFILMLTPLFGGAVAETVAMTIVPLIGLLAAMWLVWKISTEIFDRQIAILAAALTATAIPVVAQLRPMRIDHHGWQIVLALLALWTMFWSNKKSGGLVLGSALSLWLSISMEGLPLTIGFVALLAWRWSVALDQGDRLFWTLSSFLASSTILYFVSQGHFNFFINYCDAISPAHLLACWVGAAFILPAIKLSPSTIWLRFGAIAIAGTSAFFVLWFNAPQCVGSAFAEIDPVVRETWLNNVHEGLPIWHQPLDETINLFGGTIFVGLCCLIFIWTRQIDGYDRAKFFLAAYAFLWAVFISVFVQRASSVAAAYAIPMVGWAVYHVFKSARQISSPITRILATVSVVFLILPGPLALGIANIVTTRDQPESAKSKLIGDEPLCDSSASIERLNVLPKATLLAPLDLGPEILVATPHNVLATSHHRNDSAMADQIQIFTSPVSETRKLLQDRNIDYVIICKDEAELHIYAQKQPIGLAAMLLKGEVPNWLQPVHLRDSGLKIWRIVPKSLGDGM